MSENAAQAVALQVLAAVRFLHSRRAMHRDLKAENLLVFGSEQFGGELVPKTPQGLTGHLELGYVFYRQLFFVDGPPQIQDLDDTWMIRLGLGY